MRQCLYTLCIHGTVQAGAVHKYIHTLQHIDICRPSKLYTEQNRENHKSVERDPCGYSQNDGNVRKHWKKDENSLGLYMYTIWRPLGLGLLREGCCRGGGRKGKM